MNVIVGPSICFGFDFKPDKISKKDNNDDLIDEIEDIFIDDEIPDTKVNNIIISLKKIESEHPDAIPSVLIIFKQAIEENTNNLTNEQKQILEQELLKYRTNINDPKLKELLLTLYQ